jgi:hypothetical protein
VKTDIRRATLMYKLAADQGNTDALAALARQLQVEDGGEEEDGEEEGGEEEGSSEDDLD